MKFISLILLLAALQSSAQITYSFPVPTVLTGDYSRAFAGSEKWQGTTPQIVSSVPAPQGFYRRISALEFVTSDSTVYDWTKIRSIALQAGNLQQAIALGYMTVTPFAEESGFNETDFYDGGFSSYPEYLHDLMQAEGTTDWVGDAGHWIPNYNSPHYHRWLYKWNVALDGFLDTATVVPTSGPKAGQTIAIKNMISCLDIRGIGSYGEGHHYSSAPGNNIGNFPAGTFPTVASYKAIIDAHVQPLQEYYLVGMIALFDGQRLINTWVPVEVGVYLLKQRTLRGPIGWRRDQWGANDNYLDFYLKNNPGVYQGYHMDTAIMNRWRYAPITGEPPGGPDFYNGNNMGSMPQQVRTYRPAWIGNGNYGGGYSSGGAWQDSMRLAFYLAGYHYRLTGGSAVIGSNFQVNLKWRNYGLTPSYDNWTVQYSLRTPAGATVWTGNSSFNPYLFLPDYGEVTKTDNFNMPAVAPGVYNLFVTVKDPEDYLAPMSLQITGRQTDGSYQLSTVTIPTGTANRPATANAGLNQTIVLPVNSANLSGGGSTDDDGTIVSYQWAQVSGPSTATMSDANASSNTVSDLVEGVYIFSLTVEDNDGATSSDNVTVTVNAAPNESPVADAGSAQIVAYPGNSVFLDGSNSTDDSGITSYLWEKTAGPVSFLINTPTEDTTTVNNLVPGIYFFTLTVQDAGGLTNSKTVQVTVTGAPVNYGYRQKWQRKFVN